MDEQREKRLSYYHEQRKYLKNIQNTTAQNLNSQQKNLQQKYQDSGTDGAEGDDAEDDDAEDGADTHTDAGVLGEFERNLLKKFYNKVNKFKHSLCTTCNESFPSIPKKFSKDNNMDPGKVPDKLRDLTEIEKMLVAQVFPVMSVYRLCGEFASKLPRHPSLLDMLVIRHQSVSNAEAFRDFKVRRDKVIQALIWLKQNNRYYANVIIDHEILQSLPIDGTIDDQLQDINEDIDYDESENDVITHTFILLSPSANREDTAIRNTLNRIQNENHHIMWSQINGNPVNEFQTPG
ncbi:21775_t:CDS:2, partial [Rhizophagus irregularis]